MIKYIATGFLFFTVVFLHAQSVEIKKDIVYIDGQQCLKVDRKNPNNVGISDLDGNDLIYLKYADDKYGARYNNIVFVNTKSSFTSKQYIYTVKLLVKRLLDNHVLENCKLNDAKVENFIAKYNEPVAIN